MKTGEAALVTVLEEVTRLVRRLATFGDLSLTAAMVLARLDREGPVRLTELAVGEGLSQPGMTQLVKRLERDGLVRRQATADDRRGVLVAVTEAGSTLVASRRAERASALHRLMSRLDGDDRAAIAAALPALSRLVDAGRTA
jgi:DNA-binding MarR family transcriptional regulator